MLPSVCCFESKDGEERAPSRIRDALGEMVVPDHVGRLQILKVDGIILLDQRVRFFVVKVAPLPLHLLVRLCEQVHRLAPSVAPLLPSGYAPLAAAQICFRFVVIAGVFVIVPSASVANDSKPRSMPVSRPVEGVGSVGASVQEKQAY